MKKLLFIVMLIAPVISFSQGKGVPEKNGKFLLTQKYEYVYINVTEVQSKGVEFALFASDENGTEKRILFYDSLLDGLNTLGDAGFQLVNITEKKENGESVRTYLMMRSVAPEQEPYSNTLNSKEKSGR